MRREADSSTMPDIMRSRSPHLLAGLAFSAVAIALFAWAVGPTARLTRRPARTGRSQTTLARLGSLPLHAQSVISTALGEDESAYAARPAPGGYRLAAGGVAARLASDGEVTVQGSGGSISMALSAVGRDSRLRRVRRWSVRARRNRLTYSSVGLAQWYAAGPLGLEQGFTVARRPSGAGGTLTLALRLWGSARVRRQGSGIVLAGLRYGGVVATDASGRRLPVTLALRGRRLLLQVTDRQAEYPVRIDPFIDQQSAMVGADATGPADQGWSVALSADGTTALIGGPDDNGGAGAAWVFVRAGGTWIQQGPKVVGSGAVGLAAEGWSVALSGDGNTALIGGLDDNNFAGAAWVFTRAGGVWTQQAKLVGAGIAGSNGAEQGSSVALSTDGNTALIGGPTDNGFSGAVWVFTRSAGAWTQQGSKLVGSGAAGPTGAEQGFSVALSGDGGTALVGGLGDDNETGAAWVFTDSGAQWTQQGPKLFGAGGAPGGANQGISVALSADGATALVGGWADNGFTGATWVYVRSAGVWSQQGPKLVGSGASGSSEQGARVALSADGDTALIGGPGDASNTGAAWEFVRTDGSWRPAGPKLVAGPSASAGSQLGHGVAVSADGHTALLGAGTYGGDSGATFAFAAPALSSPSHLAFGAQTVGQPAPELWLPVEDSGQAPLTFSAPASISGPDSSDFTIASGDDLCQGATLEPLQTCWIGVWFEPSSAGYRSATLSLGQSNADFTSTVALWGIGLVPSAGPVGAAGPPGHQGSAGPAGQVELVTCKPVTKTVTRQVHGKPRNVKVTTQVCTVKLVSGPVTFTTTGAARAALDRGGVVYARGLARSTGGTVRLAMTIYRPLRHGHYTLRVGRSRPVAVTVS
jgi:hypothetical protein